MKLVNVTDEIAIELLLSSRTYDKHTDSFQKCVYCHKSVENDYFEFNDEVYQPYRCNCDNAKKELEVKQNLLNSLIELDTLIDIPKVNSFTKEYEISKVIKKYEGL